MDLTKNKKCDTLRASPLGTQRAKGVKHKKRGKTGVRLDTLYGNLFVCFVPDLPRKQ